MGEHEDRLDRLCVFLGTSGHYHDSSAAQLRLRIVVSRPATGFKRARDQLSEAAVMLSLASASAR